jgi:hypothetical protein
LITFEAMNESKPTHAKPSLYAYYFEALKVIAKEYGYNLVIHGSMNRDLDLIAIPWVNDPKPELDLINALCECLGGKKLNKCIEGQKNIYASSLPGGRTNYVIDLHRGGYKKNENGEIVEPFEFTPDPEYYIDISVTPLVK